MNVDEKNTITFNNENPTSLLILICVEKNQKTIFNTNDVKKQTLFLKELLTNNKLNLITLSLIRLLLHKDKL